jgi:hypothetical protein
MRKGIWIESPGEWTGWTPLFCSGNIAVPMTFEEAEIGMRLEKAREAYPNAALIEAREAPEEIEWSEAIWRQCKGMAA